MTRNLINENEYYVLKNVKGFDYLIKDKNGRIHYGRDIEKYDFLTGEWITDIGKVPVSDSYLYKNIQWNNENKIDIQDLLINYEVAYVYDESIPTMNDIKNDRNYEINQSQLANMFDVFLPKINHEEYKVLKGLDDKWKWIARDSKGDNDGNLFAYFEKPYKHDVGVWHYGRGVHIDNRLFQFIQWDDSEPYDIQELIEEYLDDEYGYFNMKLSREFEEFIEIERGEAEVKKDIKWLKGRFAGRKLFSPSNDREIGYNKAIDEFSKYVDQLDEPETLSEYWINDNVEYAHYMTPRGTYSSAKAVIDPDKLQNVIVPKKELPVTPNYVAKWIEEERYYLKIGNLYLAEPLGDMTSDIVRMTRDKGVAYQFTDEKSIATHLDKFEGVEAVKVEELEDGNELIN